MLKKISFVFALILLVSVVSAIPGIPYQLYGSVSINGAPAPDGTIVSAKIQGDTYQVSSKGGKFGYSPGVLFVQDPDNDRSGKNIEIYVNNNKVSDVIFETNGYTELTLTSTEATAPANTGTNTGSSGGGGGGGGGSSGGGSIVKKTSCVELWECTEWGECNILGKQTRTCTDKNACGTVTLKPEEIKDCVVDEFSSEQQTAAQRFISRILGAVVGPTGNIKISGVIILLVIILAIGSLIVYKRRSRRNTLNMSQFS